MSVKNNQNSRRWNCSLAWELVHLLVFNQIKALEGRKRENDCLPTSCRDATLHTRKTALEEL